ncbi:MAG: Gfo/Idh/MocA family oxidoreductase [Pseudolysinimonas sp.]
MTAPDSMIGFAIVGTGSVSREIAHDLRLTGNARGFAVVSRDRQRGRAFANEFGLERVHDDLGECLADPHVDVVYIATPHATHAALAEQAMLAGKHVLVEKPITISAAELGRLTDLAANSGLFLMEAMWMLFNETIRDVLDQVYAGAIGDVRSVQASLGMRMPRETQATWSRERGDSALLNQGIYPLTLAHALLGVPESIHSRSTAVGDGVDASGHVTLEYSEGRFAQLAWSMVEPIAQSATINGTQGWISIAPPFWFAERAELQPAGYPVPPVHEIFHAREGWGYTPMLRAVAGAVRRGDTDASIHSLRETAEIFDLMNRVRTQR